MSITGPGDLPKVNISKVEQPSQIGDVRREVISAAELLDVIIVPNKLIKANENNGVSYLHKAPEANPYENYFANAEAEKLPSGGDPHLAAIDTFRKRARASGHVGEMPSHKKPKIM